MKARWRWRQPVLMIEPTLAKPRSEIIEFLIGTLGVDPVRVIELARKTTGSIAPCGEETATPVPTGQAAAEAAESI